MHDKRRSMTIERTFAASLAEVWELWTTKDGIESWWGPDGFRVEVRSIDLRPGGELRYAMIAAAPDKIAFMRGAGMPVAPELVLRYTEVVPQRLLRYVNRADFIPGVAPYDVDTAVELRAAPGGVRLLLTFQEMHDETWTGRQAAGWEDELGRLAAALRARSSAS
jgi:uncharacterized protein YndB with AHSA1/START domain